MEQCINAVLDPLKTTRLAAGNGNESRVPSDYPKCVNRWLIRWKIAINDGFRGSNQERAKLMRGLAIAQLGTAGRCTDKQIAGAVLSEITGFDPPKALDKYIGCPLGVIDQSDLLNALLDDYGIREVAQGTLTALFKLGTSGSKWLDLL